MFFHPTVFFNTLIFLALLEFFSLDSVTASFKSVLGTGAWQAYVLVAAMGYVTFAAAKRIGQRIEMVLIPVLFALATMILLSFVTSTVETQVFVALSTVAYYFILLGIYRLRLYSKDQTARAIMAAAASVTAFFFYSMLYGIYVNFALPLWILMGLFSAVSFAISFQYFSLIAESRSESLKYGLILGLIMAEIAWVVNFWPFGYLTTGAIALIFYYVFWDIAQAFFLEVLTKRRVAANVAFFSAVIGMILMSSKWLANV